jgi:hypothetical protein
MRREELVGVWVIRSFVVEERATGRQSRPWGDSPAGSAIFHPDGRMMALITAGPREAPSTLSDRAVAFDTMLAYSGAWRIDPPDALVTTVDIAWFEPWRGTEQIRYGRIEGDELTLTSAPLAMPDGATVHAVVRWRREASRLISN